MHEAPEDAAEEPRGRLRRLEHGCDTGNVLLVNKGSPFRTLGEFLGAARARGVRYGSSGIGSITHLMGEVLAREANAPRLDHVPYRGSAPAMQDLFGGPIESVFDPLTTNVGMIRDGTMRALAVSTPRCVPAVPEVPTFAELGLPRLTATTWIGVSGPEGLSEAIARRVMEAAAAAVARPDVRARLEDLASYPPEESVTGAAYPASIAAFVGDWTAVARGANITAG
jgi:tripartite-type tricarboxylate transporter receptor subunit TctC